MGARPPQFGEHSGDRGSNVVPRKIRTVEQNLSVDSETLSLSLSRFTSWTRCELLSWWTRPPLPSQLTEGVELGGTKWSHSNLYYLVSPNSDQSAISNLFSTTQHRYRQTADIISIAIADLDTVR